MLKAKVLCVDGDPALLDLFVCHLTPLFEFGIVCESSLEGAKKKLLEGPFDLITMSLSFTVENPKEHLLGYAGLTFLQDLRKGTYGEELSDIPVLVISGALHVGKKLDDVISPLGKTWFVDKPFSIRKLKKLIVMAWKVSKA